MKKPIIMILAIFLSLSIAACGSASTTPAAAPQTLPTATPAPTSAPTPTPVPTPEPTEEIVAPEPEPEPSSEPVEVPEPEVPDAIDPDLLAFLESYEAFVDEYCSFMKSYMENPTDLNLLMKYSSILTEYSKFTAAVEAYDTSTMNEAESLYFAEVTLRCSQKMLKALG